MLPRSFWSTRDRSSRLEIRHAKFSRASLPDRSKSLCRCWAVETYWFQALLKLLVNLVLAEGLAHKPSSDLNRNIRTRSSTFGHLQATPVQLNGSGTASKQLHPQLRESLVEQPPKIGNLKSQEPSHPQPGSSACGPPAVLRRGHSHHRATCNLHVLLARAIPARATLMHRV